MIVDFDFTVKIRVTDAKPLPLPEPEFLEGFGQLVEISLKDALKLDKEGDSCEVVNAKLNIV